MRRFLVIIVCLVVLLSLNMGNSMAQHISPVSRLNQSGDIAGTVVCSYGSDVNDVLVFIPGHSFMVRTDVHGSFRIYNVPEGRYELVIEGMADQTFVVVLDIEVDKKRVTDLGTVDLCSDSCYEIGDCPEGYYCATAIGDCTGEGTCREIPLGCPDVWEPVCGCDDRMYGNACEAAAMGVNIAYEGACMTPARPFPAD